MRCTCILMSTWKADKFQEYTVKLSTSEKLGRPARLKNAITRYCYMKVLNNFFFECSSFATQVYPSVRLNVCVSPLFLSLFLWVNGAI